MDPRTITNVIPDGTVNYPQIIVPIGITQECYRYTVESSQIRDIGVTLRVKKRVDTPEITILFTVGGRGIGFYFGNFTVTSLKRLAKELLD